MFCQLCSDDFLTFSVVWSKRIQIYCHLADYLIVGQNNFFALGFTYVTIFVEDFTDFIKMI